MQQRGLSLSVLMVVGAGVALAGCSHLSISNGSMDYTKAQSIAPVTMPDSLQTRQIAPLYPVPTVPETDASKQLVLTNAKGNRYQLPKPKPVDVALIPKEIDAGVTPSQPLLVVDGNGFPILKISGDSSKIWDAIGRSLSVSNTTIVKSDVAASRYDVKLTDTVYQLRLGRIGNVTTVTLQKADDTMADKTIATELLARIGQNWS
jgi:uncharacterized lipoprotein